MRKLGVAVIPGDGIGPEITSASLPVVEAAAARHGVALETRLFEWGGEYHLRHGAPMPADALDIVRRYDAVLFGAVGRPDVPDHELVWGLIIKLRQELGLSVNLRPVRSWPGVPTPLRDPGPVDLLVVRENTEGEYVGAGGVAHRGEPLETAVEVAVHSRPVIEQAARVAFDAARGRRGRVTLVTKSNAMRFGYPLWDRVVGAVAADYPDVAYETVLVDAMAARLMQRPTDVDVLLCSNLFGDILSDLAAVLAGGLGMAPSANVCPGASPGIFEPVHGSAPDIAGRNAANPAAYLLSAALMFEHVDLPGPAAAIRTALAAALEDPALHTPDLGGTATTKDVAAAVLAALSDADTEAEPEP